MEIDVKTTNPFVNSDLDRNSSLTTINGTQNYMIHDVFSNFFQSLITTLINGVHLRQWQLLLPRIKKHKWLHEQCLSWSISLAIIYARFFLKLLIKVKNQGWKNVLDCLLHFLRANLLPLQMIQLEDFVDPRGHVSLKERFKRRRVAPKKEESGLFSWLGFTSAGTGDSDHNRRPTEEERELCKVNRFFY